MIDPEGKRDDYISNGNDIEYGDIQQNKAQDNMILFCIKLRCGAKAVIQIQGVSRSNMRHILIISEYSSPEDANSNKYGIMYCNAIYSHFKATYYTLLYLQNK